MTEPSAGVRESDEFADLLEEFGYSVSASNFDGPSHRSEKDAERGES